MKNTMVTFEECKKIRLDILREIDCFCKANHLTYFLAYGTLLGAVRHQGFIPWDDDADIMMPRKDMEILKKTFSSSKYKYSDVDTEKNYEYPFPRITCKGTFDKKGLVAKYYGVNIDLYPIDGLPEESGAIDKFFKGYKMLFKPRLFLISVRNLVMRLIPVTTIPFVKFLTRRCVDYIKKYDINNSSKVFVIDPRIYNRRIFDDVVEVLFEGFKFNAPVGYDEFLRTSYGDYMQLPPENKRIPYHGGNYYWK